VRHGCRQLIVGEKRSHARAACCAVLAFASLIFAVAKAPAADDDVSPWATGGAKTKAGDTDGKAGGASPTQISVAQTYAWPGYVIQGGAIPKDWKPQAIPYQSIGPDGRPAPECFLDDQQHPSTIGNARRAAIMRPVLEEMLEGR